MIPVHSLSVAALLLLNIGPRLLGKNYVSTHLVYHTLRFLHVCLCM